VDESSSFGPCMQYTYLRRWHLEAASWYKTPTVPRSACRHACTDWRCIPINDPVQYLLYL